MKIHIATRLWNSAHINNGTVRLVRRHVVPSLVDVRSVIIISNETYNSIKNKYSVVLKLCHAHHIGKQHDTSLVQPQTSR